jgi:hypothetical protein
MISRAASTQSVTRVERFLETPEDMGAFTGEIWKVAEEKPFILLKRKGRPRKIRVRQ